MSNISSFDYRRKSLAELQRQVEQLNKEVQRQQEWNDWQTMVIDTMEVQFSEFKSQHEFMIDIILTQLRFLNKTLQGLNNDK